MQEFLTFKMSVVIVLLLLAVSGLSTWLFSRWLTARTSFSTEDRIQCWEIFIKSMSTFAVLVAGLTAFLRYIDQREMELSL